MIAVGVDTHKDRHLLSPLMLSGSCFAEITITTDTVGYRQFVDWLGELEGDTGRDPGRRQLRRRPVRTPPRPRC